MPLKKSLLLACSPVCANFKFFANNWIDFQNGLFFGVLGSSPLSARAALIIAASALFASSSKVLAFAFCFVAFFCSVFVSGAGVCAGFVARATVKMLSKTQSRRGRSLFIVARTLSGGSVTVNQ